MTEGDNQIPQSVSHCKVQLLTQVLPQRALDRLGWHSACGQISTRTWLKAWAGTPEISGVWSREACGHTSAWPLDVSRLGPERLVLQAKVQQAGHPRKAIQRKEISGSRSQQHRSVGQRQQRSGSHNQECGACSLVVSGHERLKRHTAEAGGSVARGQWVKDSPGP